MYVCRNVGSPVFRTGSPVCRTGSSPVCRTDGSPVCRTGILNVICISLQMVTLLLVQRM